LQYIIRYTADVGFKEGKSNDDMIEFGSETKCALRLVWKKNLCKNIEVFTLKFK